MTGATSALGATIAGIGFWTDGMLVTHTTYLIAGQYQRGTQPDYSDQVEVVGRVVGVLRQL